MNGEILIHFLKKHGANIDEKSIRTLKLITDIEITEFISLPSKSIKYKWCCLFRGTPTSLNFVRKNSTPIPITLNCKDCGEKLAQKYVSNLISFISAKNVDELSIGNLHTSCKKCATKHNSIVGLEKRKITCLKKYGYEYKFLDPSISKNLNDILEKKYGPDYRKISDEKRKKTNIEKYGVDHNTKIPGLMQKMIDTRKKTLACISQDLKDSWNAKRMASYDKNGKNNLFGRSDFNMNSKIAKDFIHNIIYRLNLSEEDYVTEYLCSKYRIDLLLKNTCIIEFYGDFWHGNPDIYKYNDIVGISNNVIVEDVWQRDDQRLIEIQENLKLPAIIVWERGYKKNKNKIILDVLQNIGMIKKYENRYQKHRFIH